MAIVHCQDPSHDVPINIDAERMGDLLDDAQILETGVTKLEFYDGRDEVFAGTLWARLASGFGRG